jgi:hypothetical protein
MRSMRLQACLPQASRQLGLLRECFDHGLLPNGAVVVHEVDTADIPQEWDHVLGNAPGRRVHVERRGQVFPQAGEEAFSSRFRRTARSSSRRRLMSRTNACQRPSGRIFALISTGT